MKNILMTTSLMVALASPAAFAGDKDKKHDDMKPKAEISSSAAYDVETTGEMDTAELLPGEFTDDHDWVGKTVYDADMVNVGEVERIAFDEAGEVNTIIIEMGGVLDVGGEEVVASASQFDVVISQGDESDAEIQLAMTADQMAELPRFDEDSVSDYPLSDDDLIDEDVEMDLDAEEAVKID